MSCLALALQPANGSDILLQTREWFPPARALAALSSFRLTRLSLLSSSHKSPESNTHHPSPDPSSLGDDPLTASSGQLTVGVESKFRVVYRLVNTIYVLGITTLDSPNIFDTINTVNQSVSVLVAACRGVDVTPEKLHRKYPEIYMALDIVLRGVGSVRLSTILSSIHGDSIAKMVHSAVESENRVRGADLWAGPVESLSSDRASTLNSFTSQSFELPTETLSAGDEFAATIAPLPEEHLTKDDTNNAEEGPINQDPFAASEKINKPEEALAGGFKKTTKETDSMAALAGLDVSSLPPAEATKPTFVGVEGFEGEYGGIEFSNEEATLSEAFEGFDKAFGGGLDASEFVATDKKKTKRAEGLGGLEFLTAGGTVPGVVAKGGDGVTPLENLLVEKKKEMTAPEMYISEEINAEFRESLLERVAFKGTIFLRTLPPKQAGDKETEFSFKVEGTNRIKRAAMMSSCVSSLENGMFHVRTPSKEEPIPVIKFSLQPKLTPLPLRVRLVKRHTGTLLSVMIQYVSNPELPSPLTNVTFIMKLPCDPTLLTVSPKAVLNRADRELRWHVADIPLKDSPGKLRARMPVDVDSADGEVDVVGMVKFSAQGAFTLSGVYLRPASEGIAQFNEDIHRYASGSYLCI